MFFWDIFCCFFFPFVPWRRQVFRETVKDRSKLNFYSIWIYLYKCICFTPELHYALEVCLDVSTHMDRSLSFGVERRNSPSELVFRVCFLMCLWPRRKIWTVTKGDIHRKSQRNYGQLAKFFFSMEGTILQSEKEVVCSWMIILPPKIVPKL